MNMKKYIKSLLMLVLAAMALTGCREEVGTDPGNDGTPIATVYQYTAGAGYNSDNDCLFRVATNAAVGEVYYLAELKTEKEARNMTADAYAEYVVAHGTKVDVKASDYKDVYVTNLHGLYAVTVVAVKGGTRTSQSIEFAGLDYKPYGTGVYHSDMFGDLGTVNVEYSEVGSRYRIKDVWGVDHGFAFSINGTKVTVYPQTIVTGREHPRYGMISANDQSGSTYDEATKTVTFNFLFSVSAGSFGVKAETLQLNN
jgi:hypothetical protein